MCELSRMASVADLRHAARRRLPRLVFDFIDGGAESEVGLQRNEAAFSSMTLSPRALRNASKIDTAVTFLGQSYSAPLGIAPMGMSGLSRHGADAMLAGAALQAGLPFCLSTAATASIEDVAAQMGAAVDKLLWFQLYMPKTREVGHDLMARALACGVQTLVLTVDVPLPGRRLRDTRNGFSIPFRIDPLMLWDFLRHPAWAFDKLLHGQPRLANWKKYAQPGQSAASLAQLQASQVDAALSWDDVADIRRRWPHKLIVKGLSDAGDVATARELGADAAWLSNHGGRQLDASPAPLHALRGVREAVGPEYPLVIDSGVRYGGDIVKAMMAGASFCFTGRAPLYGVAAYGAAGAVHALQLLLSGMTNTLGLIGRSDFKPS
ncbi:MAG: alpha-hydroxy acid oxidase [Pseudomonadota bacterium]